MLIKNAKIVTLNKIIEKGYVEFENGKITGVFEGNCDKDGVDADGKILMPGFVDIHVHGSSGIDFMDATKDDYKIVSESLFKEGVTTYLATTLTSDYSSLKKVCLAVKDAVKDNPSLGGIHFEGPYISELHKGAQNAEFIRLPDYIEFLELYKLSGNNVRNISMAPEKEGSLEFIKKLHDLGVTTSAGHSDASFEDMGKAIECGLTNVTHTHNAQSGHHHRKPGIVTSAFYYDKLNCEFICDFIHVCKDALIASYKIVGPDRFIVITDALKIKNSDIQEFELFGLPCERKNGAAYLKTGPLAGSLLTMNQGLKNMSLIDSNLVNLSKITSYNAAKSVGLKDRGEIACNKLADFVLLDHELNVCEVYKLGKKVL